MSKSTRPVVIVGAGQAGLTMSYWLQQQGIEHALLERARIGERWRSERWDSLRFQFPGRYLRLPGYDYQGADPDAFPHRDEVINVIERYANHIQAPVRTGIEVTRAERLESGHIGLQTSAGDIEAANVVLATGPYQRTLIPAVAEQLPKTIRQLPASGYTNAAALPAGAVLVVGAGGSGVQIAEDLLQAGRPTWLSVGEHRRVPRRHRGRDVMDWLEDLGMTSTPLEEGPPTDHAPLLTGVDGGYEVDLRRVVAAGGQLVGRVEGYEAGEILLGTDLLEHIEAGDRALADFTQGIETVLGNRPELAAGTVAEAPTPPGPLPPAAPNRLDLAATGISTVIWATGYRVDFSWVHCGEFLENGMPVQARGVGTVPGLYFLGLPYMHSARSSFFWGVGEDAAYLAEHIARRISTAAA